MWEPGHLLSVPTLRLLGRWEMAADFLHLGGPGFLLHGFSAGGYFLWGRCGECFLAGAYGGGPQPVVVRHRLVVFPARLAISYFQRPEGDSGTAGSRRAGSKKDLRGELREALSCFLILIPNKIKRGDTA